MAVQSGMFGGGWWKEHLRMSQDTFTFICEKLRPYIEKQVLNHTSHTVILCYLAKFACRLHDFGHSCHLKKSGCYHLETGDQC